jgi:alginate O-acetyltransferase complex protein AlgJ
VTDVPRVRKAADTAVIVLFLAVISLPPLGALLDNPFNAANDRRSLTPLPALRLARRTLQAFPEQFERYWNDHFGFRGALIQALNGVRIRWLHLPSLASVLCGREGWLYYTEHPPGTDYDGVRPFTTEELDRWQRVLERRRQWLQQRGCRYLLMIPPDKQTIYPEYVDSLYRCRQPSRLDQLLAHLRRHGSKVEVLDIRAALLAAKERERVYHCRDSHWNDRGAFVGYQALAGALTKWFPAIRPLPRSAFVEETESQQGGDLAQILWLEEWDAEQELRLRPRLPRRARLSAEPVIKPRRAAGPLLGPPLASECDDPHLPRAVVFHDSFFCALGPFLAEHFRRLATVWHDDFHTDVVKRERPELVIQEILERKLSFLIPNDIEE